MDGKTMMLKDLSEKEINNFLNNLVEKMIKSSELRTHTTVDFWKDRVKPVLDRVLIVSMYNLKCLRKENSLHAFVTAIGAAICTTVEMERHMDEKGMGMLLDVRNAEGVIDYCEKQNPQFIDLIKSVANDITLDAGQFLILKGIISDGIDNEVIDYPAFIEFLSELLTAKIKAETSNDKKRRLIVLKGNIKENVSTSIQPYRMTLKSELDDPNEFISMLVTAMSASIYYTLKYRDNVMSDLHDIFEHIKEIVLPGISWWLKENAPKEINVDDSKIKCLINI